jgi:plastocyanin
LIPECLMILIIIIMKTLIGSKSRNIGGIAVLFAILSISTNCSKSNDSSGTPGTNEVFIQNMAYDPATITVPANTTITWTNKDGVAHTVTSNTAGQFDSGSLGSNDTWSHLFDTPGSYPYHCTFHGNMSGTVVVN